MLSHDDIVRKDFFLCCLCLFYANSLLQLFCCVQIVDVHVKQLVFVCFLCRAAAYSKLGNYAGAVQDCERAISIDPNYSKAYGRMGYDSIFSLSFIVAMKRIHIDIKATNISHVEKMSCVYQRKLQEGISLFLGSREELSFYTKDASHSATCWCGPELIANLGVFFFPISLLFDMFV